MKKVVCLLLVCVCMLSSASISFADTVKLGKEYTIEEVCSFTVNSAKEYDVFLNQESGSNKQWIVVSVDILNWRDDSFYVKTETDAKVIYDGDFEYEADYLWTKPVGTYYRAEDNHTMRIHKFDDKGKLYASELGNIYDQGTDEINVWLKWSNTYRYNPIKDMWIAEPERDDSYHFVSQDPSKTILDQLEKRTYYYVFQVPDLVAKEEGARELIFTVAEEEYAFRF